MGLLMGYLESLKKGWDLTSHGEFSATTAIAVTREQLNICSIIQDNVSGVCWGN